MAALGIKIPGSFS